MLIGNLYDNNILKTLSLLSSLILNYAFVYAHQSDSLKASKNMLHVSAFGISSNLHYNKNTFHKGPNEFVKEDSYIGGWGLGYGINFSKHVFKNWFLSIPVFFRLDVESHWLN